jgi:hypothetical protein
MKRLYLSEPGMPFGQSTRIGIFVAVRIALKYRNTPTVSQLMNDFEMSRATAFRWRAAFKLAKGEQARAGQ